MKCLTHNKMKGIASTQINEMLLITAKILIFNSRCYLIEVIQHDNYIQILQVSLNYIN